MVYKEKTMPMNKVLVIAPHPDDETLGCGGTLLRHKHEGDEIHWLIMTKIKYDSSNENIIKKREQQIEKVFVAYGFNSMHQANFFATTLDALPKKEIIDVISSYFYKVEPNVIYLPYINDIHTDHQVVVDSTLSCVKSFRYPFVKKVCSYETVSETEFTIKKNTVFQPNMWVDISDYLEKKLDIIQIYEDEIKEPPFPRSLKNLEALATFRGSTINAQSAEGFIILKEVI
jgi:N-acetylglucosamine malate deacetylase 1